jgi:glucose-1-phosphate thymidylyltransferase
MVKNAIMLAGGTGSRLRQFTSYVSKQLLNVAGKPIIDYPLHTLQQMGIENLTITVGSSFSGQILDYVQDGSQYGMKVNYCYQPKPEGIAHAINLCERFVQDGDRFVVILGDNIYDGPIRWNEKYSNHAQIVLWSVSDLQRFGVASLDKQTDEIIKIEEKPQILERNEYDQYAITGCYLLDRRFFHYFKRLQPSARGEYEITDILKAYHERGALYPTFSANHTGANGSAFWSDAGTHESIAHCNDYFRQNPR